MFNGVCLVMGYDIYPLFGEYIRELFATTFKELAIPYTIIKLTDLPSTQIPSDTVCFFAVNIEVYMDTILQAKIPKRNNIFILWSFDMYGITNVEKSGIKKLKRRQLIMNNILNNKTNIDFFLSYDKKQMSLFKDNNNTMYYMPTGFCDNIFYHSEEKNAERIAFYGSSATERIKFTNYILHETEIKVRWLHPTDNVNWVDRKKDLSTFLCAIDIPSAYWTKDTVSITRVVSLLSSKVVLITHNDLSEFGLVYGEDYYIYYDVDQASKIVKHVYKYPKLAKRMANKAFEKIKNNFGMSKMMNNFFEEKGIKFIK